MPLKDMPATKQHRKRKNPQARDAWQERKRALNAARGKQVFAAPAIDTGSDASPVEGLWRREPTGGDLA